MGFAKIHGRLTTRVGCSVRFGAPADVLTRGGAAGHGTIVAEVWADPSINDLPPRPIDDPHDWGDYSFASQLIHWNDGSYSIRLAYYRRRIGEDYWEYASQMTVNADTAIVKELLEHTLEQQAWFSNPPQLGHP